MKEIYTEKLSDDTLCNALDWVIDIILPEIYNGKPDNIWEKTVKGGEKFHDYIDMDMRIHYLTGIACAYRLLDFYKLKNKENYDLYKLKRASFIYLFHDYNKLTDDNISMSNCENNIEGILSKCKKLKEISNELNLNVNKICHGATSTEFGTSFNNIFKDNSRIENMSFENAFSRLADSISSFYSKQSTKEDFPEHIYFGMKEIIKKGDVNFIEFQYNSLFAITGLLRSAIREYIADSNRFFLWDTERKIYYAGKKIEDYEYKKIEEYYNKNLKKLIYEDPATKIIQITDKTVRAPVLNFMEININDIKKYAEKNIHEILHMPGKNISENERSEAENYTREISNLSINNFNINFIGKRGYREGLNCEDIDEDFAVRLFSVRIFQLKYINKKPKIDIQDLRNAINEQYKNMKDKFKRLIGKDGNKSVFIVPFVASNNSLDWENINNKIIQNLNLGNKLNINFDDIISNTVSSFLPEIEDVPEKSNMSIVNGRKGIIEAREENLYGINHQTFSNRTIVSTKNSSGKIDIISTYENMIRKLIMKESGNAIMYAKFPGPISVISIESILEMIAKTDKKNAIKNIENEAITIGNMEIPAMTGPYINIPVTKIEKDVDFIYVIERSIEFARKTGMHVSVVPANVFCEIDKTTIKINIFNQILNELGFSSISIEDLGKKYSELELYKSMATNKSKIDKIMRDIAKEPMSIFYYAVDSKFFSVDGYKIIKEILKNRGVYMENLEKLAEIAVRIKRIEEKASGTEKTWLIRDGIEVLEKMMATTKKSIDELYDVCAGELYVGAERRLNYKSNNIIDDITDFTNALIEMIKDDFNGKIPAGNLKTYIISGFEYLYVLKSKEYFNPKKKEVK